MQLIGQLGFNQLVIIFLKNFQNYLILIVTGLNQLFYWPDSSMATSGRVRRGRLLFGDPCSPCLPWVGPCPPRGWSVSWPERETAGVPEESFKPPLSCLSVSSSLLTDAQDSLESAVSDLAWSNDWSPGKYSVYQWNFHGAHSQKF